jgi:molybdenum cofactor cytidylyltransferase
MARYVGIVLAAGRSVRMGRPKALLRHGEQSFLRSAVETLQGGGCAEVVVVLASHDAEMEARSAGARAIWNEDLSAEPLDSLRCGLEAAPEDVVAAVVLPVDHPLVRATTVAALIDAHGQRPEAVVRPVHEGRPGHPTLFPRSVWPVLLEADHPAGARSVVEDPAIPTVDVTVGDPGVLADVNTPEAYRRHLGGDPANP